MRALEYAFRQGWKSLWRSRAASGFAVVAITLALIVLGTLLLVTWNAGRAVAGLGDAAEFSVYLHDTATSDQRGALEGALDGSGVVAGLEYVSKDDALSRFRSEFVDLAPLTDELEGNPFPASLEVRIDPDAPGEQIDAAVARIAAMPGVADVRYDRDWLSTLTGALQTLNAAGIALVLMMAVAAAVTVAAVVRLGLQARRDEVEIMELVGAPLTFIRGPFVAEGLLQGGIGAAFALLGLWVGFLLVRGWWGAEWAAVLPGGSLQFLPLRLVGVVLLGGMALGSAGGLVAARHAGRG